MNTLDWLTAVATGLGRGEQMQQQQQLAAQARQDALRQQALENALARQKYELDVAELAQEQKQFQLKQEAIAAENLAEQRRREQIIMGNRQRAAGYYQAMVPEYQTGTEKVFAPGTPEAWKPEIEKLFSGEIPLQTLSPEVEQQVAGLMGVRPTYAPTAGLSQEEKLLRAVAENWVKEDFNATLGAPIYTRVSQPKRAEMMAELASAQAGAAVDVASMTPRIEQIAQTAENAKQTAIASTFKNLITEMVDIPRASIESKFIADYAQSLYDAYVKDLRAQYAKDDKAILVERAAQRFAATHNGMRPEVYAQTLGLDISLERLGISKALAGRTLSAPPPGSPTAASYRKEAMTRLREIRDSYVRGDYGTGQAAAQAAISAINEAYKQYAYTLVQKYGEVLKHEDIDPLIKEIEGGLKVQPQKGTSTNSLINPTGIGPLKFD